MKGCLEAFHPLADVETWHSSRQAVRQAAVTVDEDAQGEQGEG
jgi:hypothetical protein